ncbi:MAG: hypothetical protein EBY57_10995 [Actinobacteria bacterium]|nr:hypothetical protein [Actinomycetota bacterium]
MFIATPFLITGLSEEGNINVNRVGLISSTQLLGFVIGSWGSGRVFRPRRKLLVAAVLLGVIANVGSGLVEFWPLVGFRFVNGIALGTIAWLAWAEVFGDDSRTGDIAVIGPIVGTIGSPAVGMFLDRFGTDTLFIALGVLHLVPLLFVHTSRLTSCDGGVRNHSRLCSSSDLICTRSDIVGIFLLDGGTGLFLSARCAFEIPGGTSW